MKQALSGYWKIYRKFGIMSALWSFYSFYYRKYKLQKIIKKGNYLVDIHGTKLMVIPDDEGLSAELLVFGYHERDTTEFVSKYLKKNMVCLDIGANIGYYSTLYSKIIGKNGLVIAIEPSPLNFRYLKKNLEFQKNLNSKLFNCACGNENGTVNFQVDVKANKCKVVKNVNPDSNTEIIIVPLRTLNDIVEETKVNRIDFLKIDVEGYEMKTLDGAWESIRKFKPTIQIELHINRLGESVTNEIINRLKKEGYKIIYTDIGKDETRFLPRKLKDQIQENQPNISKIKKYQNSFKIILENSQNVVETI